MFNLDEIIENMMEHPEINLSAECCNSINFCHSKHPCSKGKSLMDRVIQVKYAVMGQRSVPSHFLVAIDKFHSKLTRERQS